MKSKEIYNALDKIFPFKNAEEWDFVGSLFNFDYQVEEIILCLDVTSETIKKINPSKKTLIITHHPFIFNDDLQEEFKINPYKKVIYNFLKKNKIEVISMHTNFDISQKGFQDFFVKKFNLEILKTRSEYGFVFKNNLKSIDNFLNQVGFKNYQKNFTDFENIKSIAFVPGSASIEELLIFKKEKADLLITSDVKWSTWIWSKEMELKLISIPHSVEFSFTNQVKSIFSSIINLPFVIDENIYEITQGGK